MTNLLVIHCLIGKLLKAESLPKEEENFQKVYVKAPSFLSIHMGVKADVLPPDTDCHHFVLEVFSFLIGFFRINSLGEAIDEYGFSYLLTNSSLHICSSILQG